jgi:hypothetical protein
VKRAGGAVAIFILCYYSLGNVNCKVQLGARRARALHVQHVCVDSLIKNWMKVSFVSSFYPLLFDDIAMSDGTTSVVGAIVFDTATEDDTREDDRRLDGAVWRVS